jgi:nitrate reductase cytochrome c-type subunit
MKRHANFYRASALLLVALAGCAAVAIDDSQVSLRKASVFEAVKPVPFSFEGTVAAQMIKPPPGSGQPPMISHPVEGYLPLTAKSNNCLQCHDKPGEIGKPVAAGNAMPAPISHYVVVQGGAPALNKAQFNCMTCHAPQAAVPPLVRNLSP